MAYQLDYPTVLQAWFLPFGFSAVIYWIFLILAVMVLPLLILTRNFHQLRQQGGRIKVYYFLSAMMASVGIPLFVFLAVSRTYVGAGWQLEDEKLTIKAPPVSTSIDLRSAKVALVNYDSPWQPVLRVNGYSTPGLSAGWFKLRNSKEAVVFRHLLVPRMVVVEYKGSHYIITHPGVEKLYNKLVPRGADTN